MPQENLNPSLVAGIAGVAAENQFDHIGGLVFSKNGETAFITTGGVTDPTSRVAPVDMALANKQTEEVVQRYQTALDNSQQQTQVASLDQEQQQKRNAPSIG